ncbi:ATP-dependent DNA ligase [Thiocapsa sp. UBA6158]|jgi:DNA ligase-1|uniref:ATP-dependent DNA ligase n=1 Tax=Thiocapsa sp. UBA6158 TaxID=1947692 RepID=UPI0025EBF179|nr:ATP-dependent DNA ligase [Thiocapsa sp. UBA6158]
MVTFSTTLETLVRLSDVVAARSSRRDKIGLIADLLGRLDRDETSLAASYLAGEIPQGRVGVGPAQVEALRGLAPVDRGQLTLGDLDRTFDALLAVKGAGAQAKRRSLLQRLFEQATREEQGFLARLMLGELRQGAVEGLVMEAVAQAAALDPGLVRRALMLSGDAARVTRTAFDSGAAGLRAIGLELFRPILPMLAQPAEDLDDALARLAAPDLEFKLDGARVQVHKRGEEVRVYSRQGHEVTAAVPEIPELIATLPVADLVLDGEVLALHADGRPHPFQTSMRRFGRRLDVASLRAELPLSVFFFDCIQCDGTLMIDAPARERFGALASVIPDPALIPRLQPSDAAEARAFLDQALAAGHEGIMAKDPAAPYAAGARGRQWLKIKPTHTLDLVILAAERGSGRRSRWLSNLHLGARDPAGGFVMLGKTFKGLTDAMLTWQTERLSALAVAQDGQVVHVRPELVVEIAFNELQESAQYSGGLALRFARVKRHRPDKTADQADDIATVQALFRRQIAYSASGSHG